MPFKVETVGNAVGAVRGVRESENEHSPSISIPIAFVTSTVSGPRTFRGFSCVLPTEKPPWLAANRHSIDVNESSLISKL